MKKAGSMPLHPAPPIPRNAVSLKESNGNNRRKRAAGNRSKSQHCSQSSQNTQNASQLPLADHNESIISPCPQWFRESASHLGSMPKLDVDLSDVLRETDKKFATAADTADKNRSIRGSDSEYLEPAKILLVEKEDCHLVDNDLYESDEKI